MRELVEYLTRSLVSDPDAVQVEEVESGRVPVYEVSVARMTWARSSAARAR